jgi:hypothetical protein
VQREGIFIGKILCLRLFGKCFAENNTLSVNLSIRFGKETVKEEALLKEVALYD